MKPWMDDEGIRRLDLSLRPYKVQIWISDHWFDLPRTIWASSEREARFKARMDYYAWYNREILITPVEITDRPHERPTIDKDGKPLEPSN